MFFLARRICCNANSFCQVQPIRTQIYKLSELFRAWNKTFFKSGEDATSQELSSLSSVIGREDSLTGKRLKKGIDACSKEDLYTTRFVLKENRRLRRRKIAQSPFASFSLASISLSRLLWFLSNILFRVFCDGASHAPLKVIATSALN